MLLCVEKFQYVYMCLFVFLKRNLSFNVHSLQNFCSNKCFKASQFYKKQIPVSPVWARELEPIPQVTLLDEKTNK